MNVSGIRRKLMAPWNRIPRNYSSFFSEVTSSPFLLCWTKDLAFAIPCWVVYTIFFFINALYINCAFLNSHVLEIPSPSEYQGWFEIWTEPANKIFTFHYLICSHQAHAPCICKMKNQVQLFIHYVMNQLFIRYVVTTLSISSSIRLLKDG